MGQVSVSLPSDGQTIDAADYNTPITTFINDYNSNIDNSNIATAAAIAGSKLASDGVGNTQLAAGVCVQFVRDLGSSDDTSTTAIPNDDTIPQNTEGEETLSVSITPKSATNLLEIECLLMIGSAAKQVSAALFQDSTAAALAGGTNYCAAENNPVQVVVRHVMVAGTASATTFKIRFGSSDGTSTVLNTKLGSITTGSLVVREYKAS